MARFHILNFGCRASQADGAALKRQLLEAGFAETGIAAQSDIAVLNTCTVTARADREVRQLIRRIHRENPGCKILVTGCYAQRAPQEIAAIQGVEWVVGNSHKHQVADVLLGELHPASPPGSRSASGGLHEATGADADQHNGSAPRAARIRVGEIPAAFHFSPVFSDDRTRPTLKVQDGCNAQCTFCIIPAVRGRSRSLPPDKVIEQVRALEAGGYQEVVLSGINLGGYGRDLDRSLTFQSLLELILNRTSLQRLRISSIELMDVNPALIGLVATNPRIAQHLHVPLQSGCNRILRAMHRRYWTRHYEERILAIRKAMPHAAIGADVMTGFPGETTADHETSLKFIESLPLTYLHVFPYSARPGTAAAARVGPLDGRVIHERAREMQRLSAAKHSAFMASQVGRVLPALTLHQESPEGRVALSSNYLKLTLPGNGLPPNQLIEARALGVLKDTLRAAVERNIPSAAAGAFSIQTAP